MYTGPQNFSMSEFSQAQNLFKGQSPKSFQVPNVGRIAPRFARCFAQLCKGKGWNFSKSHGLYIEEELGIFITCRAYICAGAQNFSKSHGLYTEEELGIFASPRPGPKFFKVSEPIYIYMPEPRIFTCFMSLRSLLLKI